MSATMLIATRELRERSRLFAICGAAAVMPFAAALLPGARSDRAATIAVISGLLAIALALGSALVFGASTIGRELADRRLSFYFAKPISPASIWLGKAAASVLTSIACALIVTVPALLFVPEAWRGVWMMNGLFPLFVLGGAVALFFVSHMVTTMVRSRSALIGLDFVLAAAAIGAAFVIARTLILGGAFGAAKTMAITAGAALLAILVVAPIWQLAKGRVDARLSHAALSKFLWTGVAVVLAIAGGYVLWLVSMKPSDLRVVNYSQSPGSDWALVTGTTAGRGDYYASFLVDLARGKYEKLETPLWHGKSYSRDGRTAAWLVPPPLTPSRTSLDLYSPPFRLAGIRLSDSYAKSAFEVHTRQLAVPGAQTVATGIHVAPFLGESFVLSDEGSRIAVASGRTVAVHDVATGKLLASVAVGFPVRRMFFASPDHVRILEHETRQRGAGETLLRLYDFDVAKRALTKTGQVMVPNFGSLSPSADGSKLLVRPANLVLDGRTGTTLAALPDVGAASSAMLHDGRVAMVTTGNGHARMRLFGPAGEMLAEVVVPARDARVSGELTDGKIVLVGWDRRELRNRTVFLVDGNTVRTAPHLTHPPAEWSPDPRLPRFDAMRRLASFDRAGKLVSWNPRTGETKALTGGKR